MNFQYVVDPISKEISRTAILYTDYNGSIWTVPEGHRFWEIYLQWLADGNTPQPPNEIT